MEKPSLAEESAKYEASQQASRQRLVRSNEIQARLRKLEGERRAIIAAPPETPILIEQWKADIEWHRRTFISEMVENADRTQKINFSSPHAMAFINGDRWIDALPELARCVVGDTNLGGRTVAGINEEIILLRCEMNGLGCS